MLWNAETSQKEIFLRDTSTDRAFDSNIAKRDNQCNFVVFVSDISKLNIPRRRVCFNAIAALDISVLRVVAM